jgi:N-acetyl-anhydromuramyl-L-alanine amidase AmpD
MHIEDRAVRFSRKDFLKLGGASLAGAVMLGTLAARTPAQTDGSLEREFRSASEEYGVPVEVLSAMSFVNALWEMPPPDASPYVEGDLHGRGAFGIMQLYQNPWTDTLGRAAGLTGISEEELKRDRAANIRGGAAVLAEIQGENKPSDINGWQGAVGEYLGTDLYTHEVFEKLEEGASLETLGGERVELAAQEEAEAPLVYEAQGRNTDYPKASWRAASSNNYSRANREKSHDINKVVIHVVQGSASSAVNWFQNPNASVSAHYVVNRKGGVTQCVRHKDIGYHAGHWPTNTRSIGIEHGGYVSNPNSFTGAMYTASAKLTAYICRRHKIPVSRKGIIGHYEVPGCPGAGGGSGCHTDPGRHWNWNKYIKLVKRYK